MPAVVLSLSRVGEVVYAPSGGALYHGRVGGGSPRAFALAPGALRPGADVGEALREQTGEALNADPERALGAASALTVRADLGSARAGSEACQTELRRRGLTP